MLRLATRLALTETECDIVHYLVLRGCEGTFPGATAQRCDAGQIADGLALDTHAFFALLDPTSTLLTRRFSMWTDAPSERPGDARSSWMRR